MGQPSVTVLQGAFENTILILDLLHHVSWGNGWDIHSVLESIPIERGRELLMYKMWIIHKDQFMPHCDTWWFIWKTSCHNFLVHSNWGFFLWYYHWYNIVPCVCWCFWTGIWREGGVVYFAFTLYSIVFGCWQKCTFLGFIHCVGVNTQIDSGIFIEWLFMERKGQK